MLELILKTKSKVLTTNLKTFEEQANQYLATLTTTFETDDDFAKAKEEVKELEGIEKKFVKHLNKRKLARLRNWYQRQNKSLNASAKSD